MRVCLRRIFTVYSSNDDTETTVELCKAEFLKEVRCLAPFMDEACAFGVRETPKARQCSKCGIDYVWIHVSGSHRADCPACGHDESHAIVNEALKV